MGKSYKKVFTGESLTQKQHKDAVNINNIVRRYAKGMNPIGNSGNGRYEDISEIGDYQSMLNRVTFVQQTFSGLAAVVREKFGNNPDNMVNWLKDPKNANEAYELGLLSERPETAPPAASAATQTGDTPAP